MRLGLTVLFSYFIIQCHCEPWYADVISSLQRTASEQSTNALRLFSKAKKILGCPEGDTCGNDWIPHDIKNVVETLERTASEQSTNALRLFSKARKFLGCPLGDCCNKDWIPHDFNRLELLLEKEVFGQHIATKLVLHQLQGHLTNPSPSKPLVMSFHGWTGNGKTLVANLIAQSLYRQGVRSQFYHHFLSAIHFPHKEHSHLYGDNLRSWIKGNVSTCPKSVFVFDELDKMPPGVLDTLRGFMDYKSVVDNIDYRYAVFLFISNSGGVDIVQKLLEAEENGRQREDLSLIDFESLVEQGAFEDMNGGLHETQLIESGLVDLYVPFLPLTKEHVRQCVKKEFSTWRYPATTSDIENIVSSLNYFPEEKQLLSITGCKRVAQKVAIYVAATKYEDKMGTLEDLCLLPT